MRKCLVVDDDWAVQSVLQTLLEDEGYEVDTASDGLMAWGKLEHQSGSYGAILLDLTMPGMDGLRLIQLLRQQEEAWLQFIIVISADLDAIRQAVRLGVCHVLVKPFDLERVLALVSTCYSCTLRLDS
jgi:CheY-like chemotaxis protein